MVKQNTPPAPLDDAAPQLGADEAGDGWNLEVKPIVLGAACLVLVADPVAAGRATLATAFVEPGEFVCAFDDDEYDDDEDDDYDDDEDDEDEDDDLDDEDEFDDEDEELDDDDEEDDDDFDDYDDED